MQEISKILSTKQRDPPFQLINWLREHHVDIIHEEGFNRSSFISNLLKVLSKCPPNYSRSEWDLMSMIGYIFIISTYHPDEINTKIPFKESSGPLFATILLLDSLKSDDKEKQEERLLQIFRISVNYFNTGFDTKNFYSRSPIYFYLTIPRLLSNEIPTPRFSSELQFFLNSIPHIKEEDMNYDFVVFTSEIFLKMINCQCIPHGTFEAFKRILELCSSSSYIFLQHFFLPWFCFMDRYRKEHPTEIDIYSDQIDSVTRLFSKTASLKYHELHRSFNWHLCFPFFEFVKKEEYQERILSLIGNGIRRANRFDQFPGVGKLCRKFLDIWFIDYKFGQSWALYYFLSSLDSTMLGLVSNFDRIIGAASVNSTANEEISNRKVTFSDENNFSNLLDKELYFVIKVRKFDKLDDLVPVVEEMTKCCNSIRKHLSSVVLFQLQFGLKICTFLTHSIEEQSSEDLSIPFHYLLEIIRVWTQFMIAVTHKQNVMNTYSQREIQLYPNFPPDLKSSINNIQRILVFTIFEPFFKLLAESPKQFYPTYATVISDQMFRALKEKQLTYSFIEYFKHLQIDDMSKYSESLFSHLLGKMFEIAIDHIELLFSPNSSDVELLYLWILFTIRFGWFTTKDRPNIILGIYLNTYQRLFVYNVLNNLKRIMNQSIALKLVTIYIEMEKYHYQDLQKDQDDRERKKRLSARTPFQFDDIQESALHKAYDTILTLYNDDPNSISFQFLFPFLDGAFNTDDEALITKAATACLSAFTIENSEEMISNADLHHTFYSNFFSLINKVNQETGKEILNLLPSYSPIYLQTTQETFTPNPYSSILIEEYGFELDSILEALTNNLNGNEEIYTALFLFLNCTFSIVLNNMNVISTKYMKTLKLSLRLLCHCWTQSHLQNQVEKYSYWLAHQFGDAFISCSSNSFILCLLDIAGSSRSFMTKFSLDIAKTFFEYISQKEIPSYTIHLTVVSLFSCFPPNSRLFSILCGLSLFNRYFPDYVHLDHIHSAIVQSVDIYPLDTKLPRVVNSLIKEFLKDKPIELKKRFIDEIFNAISPLSIGVRIVVMKRIGKLNLPIPIKSTSEIESIEDQDLFAQTSTLAFLCGIEGELEITSSFYQKLKKYIIERPEGHLYDKLTRKLSLLLSIFKNDYALDYFSDKNDLVSFLPYLCHGLSTPISPLIKLTKKCFSILAVKTITDLTFIKQINGFCEKPLSFFKFYQTPADRINFYVRLVRIMPTKIPADNIKLFLDAMFDYDKQSDSQQMLHFLHFIRILKFFTVSEYISTPEVKSIILTQPNPDEPYLYLYIKTICHLYENTKMSLKPMAQKYVIRFLLLFAEETVDYIMNRQRSIFVFYFLRDLIFGDMTFFNLFIQTIANYQNYQNVHPSIFKIVEFLSLEEKFASQSDFLDVLKVNFDHLYEIVSDSSARNENDFTLITYCATSLLHVMKYHLNVPDVVSFVRIFRLSFFSRSNIAKLFLYVVFQSSEMSFRKELLSYLIENATTLKSLYLQKLLPHVIRYTTDVDLSYLWDLLPQWTIQCTDAKYAFVHSILRLLEKCEPTNEALNIIYEVIKTTLTSANIRLIIYSLKVVIRLSKMKKLQPVVFMSIFRQLLTYPKFTEPPYSAYFVSLLKSNPDIFSSFSQEDIEILLNYVRGKLLSLSELKKLFSENMSIFVAAPKLMDYLPFSLLTAASILINAQLKKFFPTDSDKRTVSDLVVAEIADAINRVAHFCLEMKPTQEEIDSYLRVGFSFLSSIRKRNISLQFAQMIYFYEILIKTDKNYFPHEILGEIENIDLVTFDLICCAANNIPDVLFNSYPALVDQALLYVERKENKVPSEYLSCFIKSLIKSKKYDIKSTFEIVKQMYTAQNSERLFTISKVMISQGASWCLDDLWAFYDSLDGNSIDQRPLLKFLIMRIEDIPASEQINIIQAIFKRIKTEAKKCHIFTTSLPNIFQSQRVKISVKNYIVENLIPLLMIDNLCNAEKMLAMLYEYNNQTPCTRYIIQLLLIRAHRSHDSGSLIFIERIIQMLPSDFKERLKYLINPLNLPIEMWEDSFLPVIISLLTPKIQIWQPLFTLAHKISSIGSELIAATFSKLIDSTNIDSIKLFLNNLLHATSKPNYSQIISGILLAFHQMGIKIESHLAQEALKYTGDSYQLEYFLDPEKDEKVISHYLLPNECNDMIFATYLPYFTQSQASAIALTFLAEYDAALITYLECPDESLIFKEMRKINLKFILNDDTINSLLNPLSTIGHVNSPLDTIKELVDKDIDQTDIQRAIDANYESTIGKFHLSLFEKQQLCMTQSLIFVLNHNPTLNIDQSKLNPVFIDIYKKFESLICKDKVIKQAVIDNQSDPIVLLAPALKNSFEKIYGYSHQGMVALNYDQIEDHFNLISEKLSKETMENDDWHHFAVFLFSLFCIQPSEQLIKTAFGAYSKLLLNSNLKYSFIILNEACARIITMIRIALKMKNQSFNAIIKSFGSLFLNHTEVFSLWVPQLLELAEESWVSDLVDNVLNLNQYLTFISSKQHDSKQVNEIITKILNQHPKQFNVLNTFQNLFDYLFTVSFHEKQIQTRMIAFILELVKLDSIDGLDLMKERNKKDSISNFHIALNRLTKSQIDLLGDLNTVYNECKEKDSVQIAAYVQELTNSTNPITSTRVDAAHKIKELNRMLPFGFDIKIEKNMQLMVHFIQDNFLVLNDNAIVIKMMTNVYKWSYYIIQKSGHETGYNQSTRTLANILIFIKQMLQKDYSSRIRKLMIVPTQFFEVGHNMLMVPLVSEPTTLENIFQESELITSNEFLQNYTQNSESGDNGLTENGINRVAEFDTMYLLRKYSSEIPCQSFIQMKSIAVNSVSVLGLIRHLFNAPYPDLQSCIFCPLTPLTPLLYYEFDHGIITDTQKASSSFRLSPSIQNFFGDALRGRCIITTAVVSRALLKNLECIRSLIEILIGDECFQNGLPFNFHHLIDTKTRIENRFMKFCPPTGNGIGMEAAENWLNQIQEYIDKAMNPDIEPIEAIPWF